MFAALPAFAAAGRFRPSLPALPVRWSDETRRLGNWLLVWVLLINAPFLPMWFIGGPPRLVPILVLGGIGLIVRAWPVWQRRTVFLAGLTYAVLHFVAGLFNLSITSLLYSIRFFLELSPSSSIEYLAAGALVFAVLAGGLALMRRPMAFTRPSHAAIAVAVVLAVIACDWWALQGARGHYKREAPSGARFESAAGLSGWAAAANGKHHQLLVVVESLGVPARDAELKRKLFALYHSPDVQRRYTLTTGKSLYYNSTTAGEVRELCGRWGDYYPLVDHRDDSCLPARWRRQGYRTLAWHSFAGDFFEREKWYPHIGFEEREFRDQLHARGARKCGGVFAGVCDRDVPRLIGDTLAQAKQPTFLYWLTVNSHLPVPPGMNLEVDRCDRVSPRLAREFPMICRQFAIWDALDRSMINAITADGFPDTEILIVGDHMPPYFDRANRQQFDPEHVPWIRLSPRVDFARQGEAKAHHG